MSIPEGSRSAGFGVVIVNYNSAKLSLDAALSVLGDTSASSRVIIVDNASTDDSLDVFAKAFADPYTHICAKPDAVTDGNAPVFAELGDQRPAIIDENHAVAPGARLTVVRAAKNGGFAAGCNIGLKKFLSDAPADYFLLLNPDALLCAGGLAAFRTRLNDENAGLCGASVLRFDPPHSIQALGGARLHPLTLLGGNITQVKKKRAPTRAAVEQHMSYPLGAAIALRRGYVEKAGLLDERYFLYYEEADWTEAGRRASGGAWRPVWAPNAVVYHRYGASTGSQLESSGRSALADHHMVRSRMLFAMKWRPALAPLLMILGAAQALRRLVMGRRGHARAILSGIWPLAPRNARPSN